VISLFNDVLREDGERPTACSAIDLGAGNGMVGEQMRAIGVRRLVGVDIIPEAAEAADRDRPGLYDDYVVADLCNPTQSDRKRLEKHQPDLLVTVSALGFGDIPPQAFWTALSAIQTPGWIAFNIKASFLAGDDSSGFCRLIRALFDRGIMQLQASRRYSHRLNVQGERLYYVAMVAKKMSELPEDLFADL
jgi:predicted TPR repeat methyltransferase